MKLATVIPVRLNSRRFPSKALATFFDKPIIDHVVNYCSEFNFENDLWVATDSQDIYQYLKDRYKIEISMIHTATCGTNRVFKFYMRHPDYDWYMSIPADEPTIDPFQIIEFIESNQILNSDEIHTFYTKFYCKEDLLNPLSCKIVTDENNYMIYNSRNVVPINKDGTHLSLTDYKKHVGIFLFPKKIFENYGTTLWEGINIESLEQNMFLQTTVKVKLHEIHHVGFGVDVPEQISHLERRIKFGFNT